MRKYLSILRIGWLDAIEYRTEFFVSVIGWGIRLFISLFLWLAVAKARNGTIGSYSFNSIISYFFIIQIISSFVFSRVGFEISRDIYRGDFANYLLKPVNYIALKFAGEVSKNAFRTILGMLIFGGFLFLFFGGISLPIIKIPLAIIVVLGAYAIDFFLICIIALSAFWITNSSRLIFIYFGMLSIFSGMILPIDLFPPKLATIFLSLPFSYIFFFPAKLIQNAEINDIFWRGLVMQWMYIALLGSVVWLMYRRGVKKFESVGR